MFYISMSYPLFSFFSKKTSSFVGGRYILYPVYVIEEKNFYFIFFVVKIANKVINGNVEVVR